MPADEYLSYARECRRWALETRDEAAREAFLEMAKVWTQLGLQQQGLYLDRHGGTSPSMGRIVGRVGSD
jgi:hypothetical protein